MPRKPEQLFNKGTGSLSLSLEASIFSQAQLKVALVSEIVEFADKLPFCYFSGFPGEQQRSICSLPVASPSRLDGAGGRLMIKTDRKRDTGFVVSKHRAYRGLFFSVLTRNSWRSMPVESVYS